MRRYVIQQEYRCREEIFAANRERLSHTGDHAAVKPKARQYRKISSFARDVLASGSTLRRILRPCGPQSALRRCVERKPRTGARALVRASLAAPPRPTFRSGSFAQCTGGTYLSRPRYSDIGRSRVRAYERGERER